METYSEAHVIEAFLLGIVVAATLATVYFKRFSKWTEKIRKKL